MPDMNPAEKFNEVINNPLSSHLRNKILLPW